jgi:hypothetical protein
MIERWPKGLGTEESLSRERDDAPTDLGLAASIMIPTQHLNPGSSSRL